jgi:Cu(I)-responsive transcriptional regulator
MNIAEAAERSGLSAKTIRYYENAGLIPPAKRQSNGYRDYREMDVHLMRFVQRARALGFSVGQCRELLALYDDKDRASGDVKALALNHMKEIDARIEALAGLRRTLAALVERCQGDGRPACPILADLASP